MGTDPGAWVLVAPAAVVGDLAPLVDVHARSRPVVVRPQDGLPAPGQWPELVPEGAAGVLLVGDRRHSPRSALPGLFVPGADGAHVPVGWLPVGRVGFERFVPSAVRVQDRRAEGPLAVLGQRSARYQRLADRLVHHLDDAPALRWGAERLTREDLCAALTAGLGAAVYLGHGRPSGWAGYRGLRAAHLEEIADRPLGCLLSVTCWTASRWRVGTSFAEQVVLQGSAAAAIGAVRPVQHLASTRVVVALAAALRTGPEVVAALLRGTFLDGGVPLPEAADLRLVGDPLARLGSEPDAARRAREVFAPPPDLRPQDLDRAAEEVA
jgi:hypothetical protein